MSKEWSAEEEANFGDLINVGVRLEKKKQKVLDAFVVSMREWQKRVSRENKIAFGLSLLADVVAETTARLGASAESSGEAGISGLSSEERTCDVADRARGAGGG